MTHQPFVLFTCKWPSPTEILRHTVDERLRILSQTPFEYGSRICGQGIRLLKIDGMGIGQKDLISIKLYEFSLPCPPEYVALSYAWGNAQDTVGILCNGYRLSVTRNLHFALLRLQEMKRFNLLGALDEIDESDYIWIDALCINQSDVAEKTAQVRMMPEIYSHASLVVAWLGEADDMTKRGLQIANRLIEQWELECSKPEFLNELFSRTFIDATDRDPYHLSLDTLSDPEFDAFISIWRKDWFSRVWIIQELISAQICVFLYGAEMVRSSGLLFLSVMLEITPFYIQTRNQMQDVHLLANISILASLKYIDTLYGLLPLVWKTRAFKATDPRDKIFALAGLVKNLPADFVDYDLSFTEILINAGTLILSQNSLDILSVAQLLGNGVTVPTWVPQVSVVEAESTYTPLLAFFPDLSSPNNPGNAVYQIASGDALVLESKHVDKIVEIIQNPHHNTIGPLLALAFQKPEGLAVAATEKVESRAKIQKRYEELLHFYTTSKTKVSKLDRYPTGEALPEAYWRTMFLDAASALPLSHEELFEAWVDHVKRPIHLFSGPSFSSMPEVDHAYVESHPSTFMENIIVFTSIEVKQFSRNFCVTSRGYIGWATPHAQVGDEIRVFRGCCFPFAVRKDATREGYRLCGDAYIHGVMGHGIFEETSATPEKIKII